MGDGLQRLIQWPLWSWRRLTLTFAGLLLLLALVGRVSSAMGPAPEPAEGQVSMKPVASGTSSALPTSVELSAPVAVASVTTSTAPTAGRRDGGSCALAATRFVEAWVQTSLPAPEWLTGMRATVTPSFLAQLATSDPSRVPATKILGQGKPVGASAGGTTFRFVTDAGRVDVVTDPRHDGCRVTDVEPVGDVPGAPTPILTRTKGDS